MAGTAKSSALGVFSWSAESAFADADVDTTSTHHILRDDAIDVSGLSRPLIDRGGVYMYMNDGEPNIPGPYGLGTFVTTFDLMGHGGTAAGDLTQTNLHALLAQVFGGADATDFGGTESGTGSDADTLKPNGGSESFTPYGLLRVGSLGDGDGDGQCYAVSSVTGTPNTTVELLTEMNGAPLASAVIYAMQHVWPVTDSDNSIITSSGAAFNNTIRVLLQTANTSWLCKGCAPQSVAISGLSAGEIPQVQITWQAAYWEPSAAAFNQARTLTEYYPAPVAAGSLFYQDVGTTTRNTDSPRNVSFDPGIAVQPVMGSGGENANQQVTGYRRVPARSSISFDLEAPAVTATPEWWDYHSADPNVVASGTAPDLKHVLYTLNPFDGRAIGIYMQRCRASTSVPTQSSVDGLNYITVTLEPLAREDSSASSEIENAPWCLSMG